jgi:hypothetical protein
VERANIR